MPILGRLFQGFNRNDQDTELIVVVNPVILREPVPNVALWSFPSREELLRLSMPGPAVVPNAPDQVGESLRRPLFPEIAKREGGISACLGIQPFQRSLDIAAQGG